MRHDGVRMFESDIGGTGRLLGHSVFVGMNDWNRSKSENFFRIIQKRIHFFVFVNFSGNDYLIGVILSRNSRAGIQSTTSDAIVFIGSTLSKTGSVIFRWCVS